MSNKPWSPSDDETLKASISSSFRTKSGRIAKGEIDRIASHLGRTRGAVKARMFEKKY